MAFVLTHQPCTECNSSDALSVNEDGSAFCFSHGAWLKDTNNPHKNGSSQMQEVPNLNRNKPREPVSFADEGQYAALRDRQISLETAKKFGVKVTFDQAGDIKKHIYPYYDSNEVVANKTRFVDNKSFFWSGENKNCLLYTSDAADE